MAFNILDVVQSGSQRIVDINDDDLPVRLLLIEQSHHAKNLDLFDLTTGGHKLPDFTDVERVVIPFSFCFRVDCVRVFPGLPTGYQLRFESVNSINSPT